MALGTGATGRGGGGGGYLLTAHCEGKQRQEMLTDLPCQRAFRGWWMGWGLGSPTSVEVHHRLFLVMCLQFSHARNVRGMKRI